MRFFGFQWFGQTNPSRFLIYVLKFFWFWFWFRRDIWIFVLSAYSQYTYRSVPHILSIQTDSFDVFSVYEQIPSVYSQYTNSEFLFKDLPHSAYFLYTYRFILRILSKRTDSFRLFGESTQIIWNIQNGIMIFTAFKGILLQKKYVCVQLDQRPTRNNRLFGPSLTKYVFSHILIICRMTIEFEYLSEFEFIFKNK